jgi:rod shape-determining protein MreC
MRNFLRLIYSYNFFFLFLVFEGFSLYLIIQNNNFQRARFIEVSHKFSGSIYESMDNIKGYLALRENNRILALENAALKNKLATIRRIIREKKDTLIDTTYHQQYSYFSAKVINNTVSKQYNYITLNKGAVDGVKPDMAVITNTGIVGIVEGVSSNYSTVLPILNRNFKVSGKLKYNNFLGSVSWEGINAEECTLSDIPHHVIIHKGDTVVTTGFSMVFPEGIPIGVITDFNLKNGNFYVIKLRLTCDLRKINYVQVIDNLNKTEQSDLEKKLKHD